MRSGRGLPVGVHWVMELYFWSIRHTRLLLLLELELLLLSEDSFLFRGRIRMATVSLLINYCNLIIIIVWLILSIYRGGAREENDLMIQRS